MRYRYVHQWIDQSGNQRLYFRRKGKPQIALPEPIGSPDFKRAYAMALENPLLVPASSMPGGIARHSRRQKIYVVQPLVGVYLLLRRGRIIYIGSSLNMPKRIAAHRTNGRQFDEVFYVATTARRRAWLENLLIRALNPSQNSYGTEVVANGGGTQVANQAKLLT
jgi:hypothetical protein